MGQTAPGTKGFVREHGMSRTPMYGIWKQMRRRCNNPNYDGYKDYGGRGIKVCPEWQDSFPTFLRDMGMRPTPQHQIERKDNDKGYSPDNCVWATRAEQALNTRKNRLIQYQGEMLPIAEACRRAGVPPRLVHGRLWWDWPQESVLAPIVKGRSKNSKLLTFRGETLTQAEWERKLGLAKHTVYRRLKKGWPLERALER